jgi:hypothetical protein
MVGFAAVQIALMRGVRVIASAGETFADRLRALGAKVTPYGDEMVDCVLEIAGATPDLVLDAAPVSGVLPDLIKIAGGDPRRVLTVTDFEAAVRLGVRDTGREMPVLRYDVLDGSLSLPPTGGSRCQWLARLALTSGVRHSMSIRPGRRAASTLSCPARLGKRDDQRTMVNAARAAH